MSQNIEEKEKKKEIQNIIEGKKIKKDIVMKDQEI